MTKERKIEILKDLLIQLSDSANILCTCEADERCEVVEECIKALEQQSIAKERYQDLVEYFGDKDIAKCVLEDREEFKKWLERVRWHTKKVDELARKLEQQPSDDCVSREGARQFLYEEIDRLNNDELYDIFSKIIDDMYNELPPVTPTQSWIPVSERLPKVGEKVLCQCQANIYDVLKLTVDGWFYDNKHCYMSRFVIAWMPLPQPYEEKRGVE